MAKKDDLDIQRDLTSALQDTVSKLASEKKFRQDLIEQLKNQEDLSSKILKLEEAQILASEKFVGIQSKVSTALDKELEIAKGRLKEHEAYNKSWDKTYEKASEVSDKITSALTDPIQNGLRMIPLVGDTLSNMVPVDAIKEKITNGLTNSLMAASGIGNKLFGSLGTTGVAAMEGVGAAGTAAGVSTSVAFGPITVILAAVAAAAYAIKKAFDYDKEVTELARGLSISKHEAHELKAEVEGISMREPLASTEELMGSMTELASAYSNTKNLTDEMITSHAKLVKFMGLSNEEATEFNTISEANGKTTRELQGDVAEVVHNFNSATGATVSLGKVLKEVANTSASVRENFKGGIKDLALSVAQAQSLGTTVDKLAQSTRGMLDIESSLSKQYEAQVLTGRELNLDRIRAAKLMGDEGKANELLLQDIEGMGDIIGDNLIVTERLADAYGMSADELIKMNERQKLQKKLGMDIATASLDQIRNAKALNAEEKEKLIREKESQSAGERLGKLWDAIGAAMDKLIAGPLAGIIDDMTSFLEDGESLTAVMDILSATITTMITPVKVVWNIFQALYNTIGGIVDALQQAAMWTAELFGADYSKEMEANSKSMKENFSQAGGDIIEASVAMNDATVAVGNALGADMSSEAEFSKIASSKAVELQGSTSHGDEHKMATGRIVSTATKAIIGEAGPEAVVPLDKFYAKLDAIAQAVSGIGSTESTGTQPVMLHVHFDDGTVQKIGNRNTYLQKNGAGLGIRKV